VVGCDGGQVEATAERDDPQAGDTAIHEQEDHCECVAPEVERLGRCVGDPRCGHRGHDELHDDGGEDEADATDAQQPEAAEITT
jgi:hypothetical protein